MFFKRIQCFIIIEMFQLLQPTQSQKLEVKNGLLQCKKCCIRINTCTITFQMISISENAMILKYEFIGQYRIFC